MTYNPHSNSSKQLKKEKTAVEKKPAPEQKTGFITKIHRDGYGFVRGEDGTDYYFRTSIFKDSELPAEGKYVRFKSEKPPGQKGKRPRIVEIALDPDRPAIDEDVLRSLFSSDSRVRCAHCGRLMIPRTYFDCGQRAGYCPFCFGDYYPPGTEPKRSKNGCLLVMLVPMFFLMLAVITTLAS